MSWAPIRKIGRDLIISLSISDLIFMVKSASSDLYRLNYIREIVEMAVRVKCKDQRISWLSVEDLSVVLKYANLDSVVLLDALTEINNEIGRLGLDSPTDVTPLIFPENEEY